MRLRRFLSDRSYRRGSIFRDSGRKIKHKIFVTIIFIMFDLAVPTMITLYMTGVYDNNSVTATAQVVEGKCVMVNLKNTVQPVSVEKFVEMVLAKQYENGNEHELLKAESVAIRTNIYRHLTDKDVISSDELEMDYLTSSQMRKEWGKNYADTYNLVCNIVAATKGQVMYYEGEPIDARTTKTSVGVTLSAEEAGEDGKDYLVSVECENDVGYGDYEKNYTFSNREIMKNITKIYADCGLTQKNMNSQIQIISKSKSGYILKMQVGNITMTGASFARIMGIQSSCMDITFYDTSVKITSYGEGDGVGMSINTARLMAENGKNYKEILESFYLEISILDV
ncbi:MAG: SpoIID/LytB domain-containing protein [Lachnospira sp.]